MTEESRELLDKSGRSIDAASQQIKSSLRPVNYWSRSNDIYVRQERRPVNL